MATAATPYSLPLTSSEPSSGVSPELSIVVPVYNEAAVLALFHARLLAVLTHLAVRFELIYVDDGSTDGSSGVLDALRSSCPQVGVARLSRNFGKEHAMTAGLELVRGQAVVVIDADLQDPPELIGEMVRAWQQGADVVNMKRSSRQGETWFKKASAAWFYKVINWL